jgi:hypothetical protein
MSDEEREPFGGLTEHEIEHLVERVTERVVENFYTEVGKSVVKKFLWLVGIITIGIAAWLGLTGRIGQ